VPLRFPWLMATKVTSSRPWIRTLLQIRTSRSRRFDNTRVCSISTKQVDTHDELRERYYEHLSDEILAYTRKVLQPQEVYEKKKQLGVTLLNVIRKQLPHANLHLFGSSCNGFGTRGSDVDISVTTHPHALKCVSDATSKHDVDSMTRMFLHKKNNDLDSLRTIVDLLRPVLDYKGSLFLSLFTAQVPVLRFRDYETGCAFDLTVNQEMAIRSSHLLRAYAAADDRLVPLVLAVKKWAKKKRINNPFEGTLGSYALTLMCIQYLQCGCNPPILNSLQKDYPEYFSPNADVNRIVNSHIEDAFPIVSDNTMSVGELFVGFFDYYVCRFSWQYDTVSVHDGCVKKGVVGKSSYKLFVEDPFEFYNAAECAWRTRLLCEEFTAASLLLKSQVMFEEFT